MAKNIQSLRIGNSRECPLSWGSPSSPGWRPPSEVKMKTLEQLQKEYAEAYKTATGREHQTPEETLQDRGFLERMIEYLKDKTICVD